MALPPSSEREPSSKSSSDSELRTGSPRLRFDFLTLFPEVFPAILGSSLLGKAASKGIVSFAFTQLRDFATDRHRTVDDTPFGGGEGMVLKADVLHAAWSSVHKPGARTVFLSPQGRPLTQEIAKELALHEHLILVCGHYEGVDERFIDLCVDEEISIGDYVLTGGELPALVLADCVTRVLPGVVGNDDSVTKDSFENGLLKYPQYTRPREFQGKEVPGVLLDGNHALIARWRQGQMEARTARKRPDLWAKYKPKTRKDV
jgi:tRNA (guanine37-N1)-methyltransferase